MRDFPAAAPVLLRRAALGRARRLARYAPQERPDIVFANLRQGEHAAFYAARLAGPAFPPVVAVSRGVAENTAGVVGVPEERLSVIYNPAVTPEALRRAEEAPAHPWFGDGGPPVVLGAGRPGEPFRDEALGAQLQRAALAFAGLVRPWDYLRVDFRVAPDGSFRFLEFNLTCNLATTTAMNLGAGAAGVSHEAMIEHFLCYSLERQGVPVI